MLLRRFKIASSLSQRIQSGSLAACLVSPFRQEQNPVDHSLPASRIYHTSFPAHALGVVELLHDEVSIALPAGSSRRFWEVVEFRPDATALETWKTPEVLGLHPRDVHLFTADTSGGLGQRAMIAPRSGAILFRTEIAKAVIYADRAVLFPSRRLQDTVRVAQSIKSALKQKSVLPFELKVLESLLSETATAFDRKTKRLGMVLETVMEDINRNFHASAAELQRSIPLATKLTEIQHDVKETLDAVGDVANYDDQLSALCLTERAKAIAAATTSKDGKPQPQPPPSPPPSAAAAAPQQPPAQQSPPLGTRKSEMGSTNGNGGSNKSATTRGMSLNSFEAAGGGVGIGGMSGGAAFNASSPLEQRPQSQQQDNTTRSGAVHAASSAYGILPSTQAAAAAAAAAVRTPHMRMASRIMESYEFRLMGTHSALNEMLENMEQTRTVWHMQLDHQRNRVLRVNLLISIASLGGLISTLPAAYFGMNLDSGLEDLPGVFWPVVQGSVACGIALSGMIYTYYKFGPKRRYAARLRDMRSLRDLLSYHMDDLESIIDTVRAKGSLSKKEFSEVVGAAVKGKPMSKEEVALLYRVFDANRDAVLELSELMKLEEQLEDQMAHHTS